MRTPLNDLTIVSITFNNPGIKKTIDSIKPLIQGGAHVIIQNGGRPIPYDFEEKVSLFNESDKGIYDALNKGIRKVETAFFMLLHAGDTFISTEDNIVQILEDMTLMHKNISLNSQRIGSRIHSSRLWRPWMLKLGAQPPHLPCIYKSSVFKKKAYRLDVPIIADLEFFRRLEWNSYTKHNFLLVQMEIGGATSGGVSSFLRVSRLLIQNYGFSGLVMTIARVPIKFLQMIL